MTESMKILVSVLPTILCAQQIQNLGPQVSSLAYESGILFKSGGATHWVDFEDSASAAAPLWLHHVNLSTGASYTINTGNTGRGNGYNKMLSATNGKLYFASGDLCNFYEYSLNGVLRQITASSWTPHLCGNNILDKAPQTATQGPNGTVLVGTGLRGTLFSYDPVADAIRDYGVIDPPAGNPTCTGCDRYVYTLQADASYAYL